MTSTRESVPHAQARRAFDAAVAWKVQRGLSQVGRLDPMDLPEADEEPVLKGVLAAIDQRAVRLIVDDLVGAPSLDRTATAVSLLSKIEPSEEISYRVEGIVPRDSNVLIVAQRKAGKTVTALNLARSYLDGSPFLGRLSRGPLDGAVAFLNYELSGHMFAAWSRGLQIPEDRLVVVSARGSRNPLSSADDRRDLASRLRDYDVQAVVIDPFSVAFSGSDANSPSEVRSWLATMEEWARSDVGAEEIVLTAHAGWAADDRARGASSLEDWPDAILTLRASGRSETRTIAARGRDVALSPQRLRMNPHTKSLTIEDDGAPSDLEEACLEGGVRRARLECRANRCAAASSGRALSQRRREQGPSRPREVRCSQIRRGANNARLHYPRAATSPAPP